MSTATLNQTDFDFVRDLVLKQSAIVLGSEKAYLVEMRLNQVVRRVALSGIEELVENLRKNPNGDLRQHVVEAMTTNETSFFRDVKPFEALKEIVLPDLMENRKIERGLNMWCAASSSGQEPYSIMMMIRENFPSLKDWDLKFIASDLSTEMVQHCKEGSYAQHEVNRGLPALFLVKYFQRKGSQWQIKEDLRSAIDFITMNLVAPWPAMPHLDIVFLRNVLIYFDVDTKKGILDKLHRLIRPGGYLFLGAAETTFNLDNAFERLDYACSGCYRLRSK